MLPGLVSAILAGGGGLIQFVGGNTATKAGASSGNSTIALDSGLTGGIASAVSNGDLVIAAFAVGSDADRTLAITDGTNPYTLIGSELFADDTYDTNLRVAYKFVSGDTATTFGPTTDSQSAGAMAVYCFRGVDQTTPLDVSVTTVTTSNTGSLTCPAITPVTAGAFIVVVGAAAHISAVDAWNTPSDLIGFLTDGENDDFDVTFGIGHKADWLSGAFSPEQWTGTHGDGTSQSVAGMTIALRPA
jgi:hypothetical protein